MGLKRITFAALVCWTAFAQVPTTPPVLTVRADLDQKANRHVEYVHDETNELTLQEILTKKSGWEIPASDNLTFGLATSTVWVRIHFNNPSASKQRVHLEFNPVFLEVLEAYDSTGTRVDLTGSTVAASRVESFPTLHLELPPGQSTRFISVKSRSNSLAISVRSDSKQSLKSHFDLALFCTLFGGLMLLMVYHLFLFATYRNWTYFFYSAFVGSTILFTVSFCSYHKQLLPVSILGFHVDFWWSALSAPILLFFMYLFSAQLLGFFPTRPYLDKKNRARLALLLMPFAEIACIVGVFLTDSAFTLIPIRLSAVVHVLGLPALAIALWWKNRSNKIHLYYAFSWVPFTLGAFLIVAWLSGAVEHHVIYSWSLPIGALFQSLLLSFAAGQQLNVITRELENKVDKLNRRDRVITSFVSSDILTELDRGEDPLLYPPRNVDKCIGFIDIHNYTTFFETFSALDCQKIINEYFRLIIDTTYQGGGQVDKIIGDAMMLEFSDPQTALKTLVQLRRNISEANRLRYSGKQQLLKFGLGVSYGAMLSANFGSSQKFDRTLVGDPVNVASRLENITRQFEVDILCSKEFVDTLKSPEFCRPAGYVLLKGRTKKSLVYECFEHQPASVVKWKQSTRSGISQAIELELEGKYVEALAAIRKMIEACPPHTFKPGVSMDSTLSIMANAITEKMRQLELSVPHEYKKAG